MHNSEKSYIYNIGGLYFKVLLSDKSFILDKNSGSFKFISSVQWDANSGYNISYSIQPHIKVPSQMPTFTGKSFDNNLTPYQWEVYETVNDFSLYIKIEDNSHVSFVKADFFLDKKNIEVSIKLKRGYSDLQFDPFMQPLGALIFSYVSHHENGILVHASGVVDGHNGYVFTAVSGTGKSTLAGLWEKTGARVINDDRLMLIPKNNGILMTNTPMPYYQDVYKEGMVKAIFLIKQSKENYIKRQTKVQAITGLMANCIQYIYDKGMVQQHLKSLTNIVEKCPVYELGFRPTTEITDIIRHEFGG